MSERLIIRLASQSTQPIMWLVYNDQQQDVIASGELSSSDELENIATYAAQRPVDVLVPGSEVNCFEVTLPKANRRQAIKAVPYMLEDELASPVEALHFTYAKQQGDQQTVYVCEQEKIQWWLDTLTRAKITIRSMIPDYLALPVPEEHNISMLQLGDSIVMRKGSSLGQTIEKSWLELAFSEHESDEALSVAHYGVESQLMVDGITWHEQALLLPMQQLAQGTEKPNNNMLTGMFKQNKNEQNHWLIWRTAASVAAVALVLFFADMYIETQQLVEQRASLKLQTDRIYKQLNPNVRKVRMVKKQMTKQLAQLGGGSNDSEMLIMLVALNDAFLQVPELTPITIKFDNKRRELRLQADAKDYQQFDKFKQILSANYTVTPGAINNNGSKINGTMTIKANS